MKTHIHPDSYKDKRMEELTRLSDKSQITFALECARRAAPLCRFFDAEDVSVDRGLDLAGRWLSGEGSKSELELHRKLIRHLQEKASQEYDRIEGMRDVADASPLGITAFQADYAASAASHALLAVLDDELRLHACASSAKLSWIASLFDEVEAAQQSVRLTELTSNPTRGGHV